MLKTLLFNIGMSMVVIAIFTVGIAVVAFIFLIIPDKLPFVGALAWIIGWGAILLGVIKTWVERQFS